jgi:hypothetical protein
MTPGIPSAVCRRPLRHLVSPTTDLRCHDKENKRFLCCNPRESAGFGCARRPVPVRGCASDGKVRLSYSTAAPDSRCAIHAGSQESRYHDDPVYGALGSSSTRRNRSKRTRRSRRYGPCQCIRCDTPSFGSRICHRACQSDTRPQTPYSAHPGRLIFPENGGPVCVTSPGTHGFFAGSAGSKSICCAVAPSREGTERVGPFSSSPEIGARTDNTSRTISKRLGYQINGTKRSILRSFICTSTLLRCRTSRSGRWSRRML